MRCSQILSFGSHVVLMGLAWLWVVPCCAASEERAGEGLAKQDQSEIGHAIAAWRKKEEKIRTLHIEWNERYTVAKGAFFRSPEDGTIDRKNPDSITAPSENTTYDVSFAILIDQGKFKFVDNSIIVNNQLGVLPQKKEWVSIGEGKKALYHSRDDAFPQGYIAKKDVFVYPTDLDYPILVPVMMALKPYHPTLTFFNNFADKYEVEPARVIIEGRSCLQFKEAAPLPRGPTRIFCVDPERDYSVVRCTILRGNKSIIQEYTYQAFEHSEFGWIPLKWSVIEMRGDGSFSTSRVATVASYRINDPIDPNEFVLEFPPGTWVNDQKTGSVYIIRPNGSHRRVLDEEIALNIPYERLLNSETGEASLRIRKETSTRWLLLGIINVAILACLLVLIFLRSKRNRQHRN